MGTEFWPYYLAAGVAAWVLKEIYLNTKPKQPKMKFNTSPYRVVVQGMLVAEFVSLQDAYDYVNTHLQYGKVQIFHNNNLLLSCPT